MVRFSSWDSAATAISWRYFAGSRKLTCELVSYAIVLLSTFWDSHVLFPAPGMRRKIVVLLQLALRATSVGVRHFNGSIQPSSVCCWLLMKSAQHKQSAVL